MESTYFLLRINSKNSDSVSIIQLCDDEWCNLRYVITVANKKPIYDSNGFSPTNKMMLSCLGFKTEIEAKDFFNAMHINDIGWFDGYNGEED